MRPGCGDQLRDATDTRCENLVGHAECIRHGSRGVGDLEETLIGDDDQRVHGSLERLNSLFCLNGSPTSLESERPCDDTNGERTERTGDLSDDRCGTGTGSSTLAGGDEDHVGSPEGIFDLVPVLLGRLSANLRIGAGTEAARRIPADVELHVGIGHQQSLCIGVDRNELDATDTEIDHPVDSVDSSAADANHFDDREVGTRRSRCLHRHRSSLRRRLNLSPLVDLIA